MTATKTLDAWTVRTLADAIGAPEDVTEHVLDRDVADGRCVRITSGTTAYYVPGALRDTLADIGAEPVEGERFRVRRAEARRHRVAAGSVAQRTADVRRRIRDLTASDDCGCGATKEGGE